MHLKAVLAIGIVCAMPAGTAIAAQYEPAQCEAAKSEQSKLNSSGIDADMQRGPEWARSNLSPERLRQIARFIELQETLLFRCPRPKPTPVTSPSVAIDPHESGSKTKERPANSDGEAKPKKKKKTTLAPEAEDAYRAPATSHTLLPDRQPQAIQDPRVPSAVDKLRAGEIGPVIDQ